MLANERFALAPLDQTRRDEASQARIVKSLVRDSPFAESERLRNPFIRVIVVLIAGMALFRAEAFGADEASVQLRDPQVSRWQIGLEIKGGDGVSTGIVATAPIPRRWPEQQLKLIEVDQTDNVKRLHYRDVTGGGRQMVISIPRLRAGEVARAVLTVEVSRSSIIGPVATDALQVPVRLAAELRSYLTPSPLIESTNALIRQKAADVASEHERAWSKVEAIYRWVQANVEYQTGAPLKGALAALKDGNGDCEEMTSLFIAMCRANKIPARTVWVPGHCYPEFHLQDAEGKGHWYPCQAAGDYQFGSMTESRPILQKGDNFKVPDSRQRVHYVQPTMKASDYRGSTPPSVSFIRKPVAMP